jgi:hypothetical protein
MPMVGLLACVMTSVAAFHFLFLVRTLVLSQKCCVEILAQIKESKIQTLQEQVSHFKVPPPYQSQIIQEK